MSDKEQVEEFEVLENISFSFLDNGDLELNVICSEPADLALLYYSIISGQVTEYFVQSVKETLDDEDFQEFMGHLSNYIMIEQSDDPLISPSSLFERGEK